MAVVHNAELVDIIVDGGESAKSLNRPGMERLLALVDAGEVQTVAMSHKRANGQRVGNIQFGYRLCADGKRFEPDPAEQSVLTEIRRLRQGGHTLRGIAATLNAQALRTRRGSAWRLEHIARIINQGVAAR